MVFPLILPIKVKGSYQLSLDGLLPFKAGERTGCQFNGLPEGSKWPREQPPSSSWHESLSVKLSSHGARVTSVQSSSQALFLQEEMSSDRNECMYAAKVFTFLELE